MAVLPPMPMPMPDPTLAAVDREMEARARRQPRRDYLGFSSIGHPCSRKLQYDLRATEQQSHDAATLKRFEDGHRGEALMASRLRMVPGIRLWTVDPETAGQIGFSDFGGRFKGHADGVIQGLIQAPETPHVWEHKATNERKQAKLAALKIELGEKNALAAWDEVYHAQAILYMHYANLTRHYLTCSTPGERTTVSVRTNADPEAALKLIDKARRILDAKYPLARISNSPEWWQCKWCEHREQCHV